LDEMHKKITELIFILTKCNRCFKMILQNNENDISKKEMIYQKQKEDTPMKKKLVLELLVSAMAANLLAGCGGSGSGSDDKDGGSSDDGSSSDDKGGGESDSGDKTVLTVTWRDEGKGESSPLYNGLQKLMKHMRIKTRSSWIISILLPRRVIILRRWLCRCRMPAPRRISSVKIRFMCLPMWQQAI